MKMTFLPYRHAPYARSLVDLDAVAADSKFVDLGADSLDTVEIMMALEEQFEITLDEEGAEKIGTVQEAADMIQTQIDA